jgi:hypothetical protein
MKLSDYRDTFYTFSAKASDLTRQLAFAGIAIIWLFKKEATSGFSIPEPLLLPGLLIVVSLALDLLHYCLASVIWRIFYRRKEKEGTSEDQRITHNIWWELPIWLIFLLKIAVIAVAYIFLAQHFYHQLFLR